MFEGFYFLNNFLLTHIINKVCVCVLVSVCVLCVHECICHVYKVCVREYTCHICVQCVYLSVCVVYVSTCVWFVCECVWYTSVSQKTYEEKQITKAQHGFFYCVVTDFCSFYNISFNTSLENMEQFTLQTPNISEVVRIKEKFKYGSLVWKSEI